MGANMIQAKYDELESIAARFGRRAESIADMSSRLRQNVEQLRHGDWIGKGSEAFFKEMDSEVIPALDRLIHALRQSQSTVNEIIAIVQQAEEEAARPFTGEASGLPAGSAVGNIVKEVVEDVVRQAAGGSQGSSVAGIVKEVVEDVVRQGGGGSQGSAVVTSEKV